MSGRDLRWGHGGHSPLLHKNIVQLSNVVEVLGSDLGDHAPLPFQTSWIRPWLSQAKTLNVMINGS